MLEKYGEKRYLATYDLNVELLKRFDLKVIDVYPVRSVFIISTDKGEKILKKIDYSIDELNFIYNGIKYIKNKFPRVMDFVKAKDGNIYTLWNNDLYCVMDLVQGRECDFNNPVDISIASRGIGELHNASEGFRHDGAHKFISGKAVENFSRRLEELMFFKSIANMHEYKNDFDKIFLENADYYIEQIKNSITLLKKSAYYKICSEEDKIVLCHHDLAHHNIMINNNEAYFVDFDYAIIDLKVHDLCNFMNKVVKNFAFDIKKAEAIIGDYCTMNNLDTRELEILHALLSFPEDFYSITRDYYTRRKEWDEKVFLERFIRKVEYREDREEFLSDFKKYLM